MQVSSPNYHVSTTSSPPIVCSLLGQTTPLGLGSPILPVLTTCPSSKASLPFKLRHKASNTTTQASNSINNDNHIANVDRITPHNNDSDASSESSVNVPLYNGSVESSGAFGEGTTRENTCSPDSVLKTENFALKSELQRLASEVATLKTFFGQSLAKNANTELYSNHLAAANHSLKVSVDRCNLYQPVSPGSNHSPIHYSEDLVDSKVLLSNVIQFQKLNDIIV